tara:strand:+ start:139 stop:2445 length:2307 start_codon:yes stop_codon:yes gene_type:complete
MTIIKNSSYLKNYPFTCLGQDLLDSLRKSWVSLFSRSRRPEDSFREVALNLLEVHADLNDFHVGLGDIETADFQQFIESYAGLLKGDSLVDFGDAYKSYFFTEFKQALTSIFNSLIGDYPEWLHDLEWADIDAQQLNESDLDEEKLLYWSGWPVATRKNKILYLDLAGLYHSHGKEFTVTFYSRWRSFFAKQARANSFETNYMARFLADYPHDWPPSTFDNPIRILRFFQALLRSYFMRAHDEGLNLNSRIKSWNRMASNVDEVFFQPGVWPEPFGSGIPRLSGRKVSGALTRISKNSDGVEVHNKLLTEIPLHYTDDQAIEALFSKVSKDLQLVERWAKSSARDLRKRQLRRLAHAPSGQVPDFVFAPTSMEEIGLKNLCAIFEHYGFGTINDELFTECLGQYIRRTEIAYALGVPTRNSLFPFMLLLVIENPQITHTFLKEFDLFNSKGQLSGFVKDDAGYHLTGYKDRRGKAKSEMKLFLSPRSASLVRQVIEITSPLRNYLKNQGDDNWRKLFLTSGHGWGYPRAGVIPEWKKNNNQSAYFDGLKQSFSRFTDMPDKELENFLFRASLASVRASKGVQIYLETQSVQKMAKALGHSAYNPELLRHYLPESILAFFQTRWIRIFQKAFICEALKDSPYLARAAGFESMKDLHEFLKNHALKDIPSHLSDPEQTADSTDLASNNDHVLISVDQGILSALLSLNHAVDQSTRKHQISGLARYWSDVSQLIEKEIQEGADPLLKEHLANARENIDPKKMEGLIYDTAA